jgi:antitoxin MazE
MKARIQKWGNSLAVRIPKSLAEETGLADESLVELSVQDGQILIRPKRKYNLDDMLAQITDENKYGEIDMGAPQGKELL